MLAEEMKGFSRMKDATTLDCVTNENIGKRKSSEKWRLGQKERLYEVVACMAVGNTVSSSGVNILPLH